MVHDVAGQRIHPALATRAPEERVLGQARRGGRVVGGADGPGRQVGKQRGFWVQEEGEIVLEPGRLGDRKKLLQLAPPFEHGAVPGTFPPPDRIRNINEGPSRHNLRPRRLQIATLRRTPPGGGRVIEFLRFSGDARHAQPLSCRRSDGSENFPDCTTVRRAPVPRFALRTGRSGV